jgi:hypothetical protein
LYRFTQGTNPTPKTFSPAYMHVPHACVTIAGHMADVLLGNNKTRTQLLTLGTL